MQAWTGNEYLAALSGRYATCHRTDQHGRLQVGRSTSDGVKIGGLIDSIRNGLTHWEGVMTAIDQRLEDWIDNPTFAKQVITH